MKNFILFCAYCYVLTTMQSCMTSDYNLNKEIDGSICFAPGGFTLGGNSSADIPLSEVIELSDSGQLTTDKGGNYLFYKRGDNMKPTTIAIGQGSLCNAYDMKSTMSFASQASLKPMTRFPQYSTLTFSQDISLNAHPDNQGQSVREFYYITTPMTINIETNISKIVAECCDYITLTYQLPCFFDYADKSELSETIKMSDFGKLHEHVIHLKGVDITKSGMRTGDEIGIVQPSGNFIIKGTINVTGTTIVNTEKYYSIISSKPSTDFHIIVGTMGTDKVTGRFDKKEDVDIDPIELDNLPEFIRDDEVIVDIENPVVRVTLDNEVPADVTLDAKMKSYKNGEYIAEVKAGKQYGTDPILFHGATDTQSPMRTNVWISRIRTEIPDSVSANVVVSDMNNLIRKVPERVEVDATARTDSSQVITLALGKEYTATPYYELVAPLKIGPEMKIVYTKEMEDIHDHTKNMELSGLKFTGDATNNIPLDLHVVATALDENGNVLKDIKIGCYDIIPANGSKSITLTMDNVDATEIQKVYSIRMKAYADSNEGLAGQYLNESQNLRIENAKITLLGAKYDILGE